MSKFPQISNQIRSEKYCKDNNASKRHKNLFGEAQGEEISRIDRRIELRYNDCLLAIKGLRIKSATKISEHFTVKSFPRDITNINTRKI